MLREIQLSGAIESIHLHDGTLDVVIDGNALSFPVGMQGNPPAPAPRRPREAKPPKETNGHAAGPALEAE